MGLYGDPVPDTWTCALVPPYHHATEHNPEARIQNTVICPVLGKVGRDSLSQSSRESVVRGDQAGFQPCGSFLKFIVSGLSASHHGPALVTIRWRRPSPHEVFAGSGSVLPRHYYRKLIAIIYNIRIQKKHDCRPARKNGLIKCRSTNH